jgi:hypothetical protein
VFVSSYKKKDPVKIRPPVSNEVARVGYSSSGTGEITGFMVAATLLAIRWIVATESQTAHTGTGGCAGVHHARVKYGTNAASSTTNTIADQIADRDERCLAARLLVVLTYVTM